MDKRKTKSSEWRAKISASIKKLWQSDDYRARNSAARRHPRPWLRGALSPSKRPEIRAKISQSIKQRWEEPETRTRWLVGFGGRKGRGLLTPEERMMHSERMEKQQRKLAETEEGRMKILRNILNHSSRKPNKSELLLDSMLEKFRPGEWKYVGDGSLIIGGLNPDFAHVREKKLVELFGRYWHEEAVKDWKRTEFGRLAIFSQLGYECIIVYDDELTEEKVLAKLKAIPA